MTTGIISRAEARARGLIRYYTGKICKNGHIADRYSHNGCCAECVRVAVKSWKDEDPERCRAAARKWHAENIDKDNAKKRAWYAKNRHCRYISIKKWQTENRDRVKSNIKRWARENPDKVRATARLQSNHRRARKLKAGGSYTAEQIADLFKKQKGKCANCFCSIKRGYHCDHIIPLVKGGSNDIINIALLCQPCNNRKHAKDPIVWAQQQGRLL